MTSTVSPLDKPRHIADGYEHAPQPESCGACWPCINREIAKAKSESLRLQAESMPSSPTRELLSAQSSLLARRLAQTECLRSSCHEPQPASSDTCAPGTDTPHQSPEATCTPLSEQGSHQTHPVDTPHHPERHAAAGLPRIPLCFESSETLSERLMDGAAPRGHELLACGHHNEDTVVEVNRIAALRAHPLTGMVRMASAIEGVDNVEVGLDEQGYATAVCTLCQHAPRVDTNEITHESAPLDEDGRPIFTALAGYEKLGRLKLIEHAVNIVKTEAIACRLTGHELLCVWEAGLRSATRGDLKTVPAAKFKGAAQ